MSTNKVDYMRLLVTAILILTLCSVGFSKKKEQFVIANSNFLALYKNRDRNPNERASARVTNSELLQVISERGASYLVKSLSGKKGWVKKYLVKPINLNAEEFSEKKVVGTELEGVTIVYAPGETSESAPIAPERSFKDALKSDISKENTVLQ